ncbi:MAG: hypothetical protein LQ350_006223 [Teloschistes chrysophthalmus]|nr:MAG: hypothetical protein LQ350_006223 [Niorma chrysophthalma]
MAPQPSEADIILNRANVALAKSQRLLASWLPPRPEEEFESAKTAEEIEKEDREIFTAVPEVLGMGAKIPEDVTKGDLKRQKLTSDETLRKHLLGKDHGKLQIKGGQGQGDRIGLGRAMPAGSKPRPTSGKREEDRVSSDDEGGRSQLGKKRRREVEDSEEEQKNEVDASPDNEVAGKKRLESAKRSKKATSYLDEVLAQKQKKHKSKKKQRVKQMDQTGGKG